MMANSAVSPTTIPLLFSPSESCLPARIKLTSVADSGVDKRKAGHEVSLPPAKRSKPPLTASPSSDTAPESPVNNPQSTGTSPIPHPPLAKKTKASKPREKKFVCTHEGCDKSFTRPCRLEEHTRSHTGDRPFKCTLNPENCDKAFLRESHLKAHIKAIHAKEKSYKCTFLIPVGQESNRGQFGFKRKASEPLAGTEEDGHRMCSAGFTTNQHLKRHMDSHLKEFPYVCKDFAPCAAGFRKKGPLTRHIRSEHQNLLAWACQHKDMNDPSKQCEAAFDTKGKLANHVASAHNGMERRRYICTQCVMMSPAQDPATPTTEPVSIKVEVLEDASLLLNFSKQTFPIIQAPEAQPVDPATLRSEGVLGFNTQAELRAHTALAHPPVCRHCGYKARRPRDLSHHIREKHEKTLDERRIWMCEWEGCSRDFTSKNNLKVHVRTVHEGLKPFICPYGGCGKRYGHKHSLTNHIASEHSSDTTERKNKVKSRKRRVKEMNLLQKLTGVGYKESGRTIACVVNGCQHRFYRTHDLKVHLGAQSAHAFDGGKVKELIEKRKKGSQREMHGDEEAEMEEAPTTESESEWSARSDYEGGSEVEEDEEVAC